MIIDPLTSADKTTDPDSMGEISEMLLSWPFTTKLGHVCVAVFTVAER